MVREKRARLSRTADAIFAIVAYSTQQRIDPGSLDTAPGAEGGGGAIRKRVSDAFSRSISHCARNDRSPPLRAWYTYPDRNCRISVGCCGFPAKYITFLYVGRVGRPAHLDRLARPRFTNFVYRTGSLHFHARNSKRKSFFTMSLL